jgi:hypothetical protein
MFPGLMNAVDKETERTAKILIVKATHSRKGVQGSRRGFNAGSLSEHL